MTLPLSIEEDYYVSHALTLSINEAVWRQQVTVDGVSIEFKLDSGATCNILTDHLRTCPKRAAVFALGPLFAAIVHKMASYEYWGCTQPK